MYQGARRAIVDWQRDVADNGSLALNEAAEAGVFDDLHRAAAGLFNAEPEDIAVGSSATELLGSLAWAVAPEAGTNVVGTALAFPSTIYPWQRVAARTGGQIRLAERDAGHVRLDDILGLINNDTAVVCISHVEYGAGQRFDLASLAAAAHEHGALLLVDATQSAGAIPIDARADALDAVVSAGYKWLCGPFGAGVMYLAPHLQAGLEPGLVGFRSHEDMWDLRADRLDYPPTARGRTARAMARFRPQARHDRPVAGRVDGAVDGADLGVDPVQVDTYASTDEMVWFAVETALGRDLIAHGDTVLVLAGHRPADATSAVTGAGRTTGCSTPPTRPPT